MKQEDFDRLVGLIYDSALDPALWQDTINALAKQIDAGAFHMLGWNSAAGKVTLGVTSDAAWNDVMAEYADYYGAIDPRRQLAMSSGPGVVIACHHHFDDRFVSGSEYYQDHFLPTGFRYVMGGCLMRSDTIDVVLGLMREPERGHYDKAHEKFMARLMPHFNRALRLMERTQSAEQTGNLAAAGQDAVSLGVVAISPTGRVLYCNRNGEALLKAGGVLCVRNGALACPHEGEQLRFSGVIEAVMKTGQPTNLLMSDRNRPDERYGLTLIPLPKRGAFAFVGERDGVLCLLAPLDRRRLATAQQLMQMFGLTAAEARLARALAAGETLESYAQASDLRRNTVKTQLRAIFEKTATDRQSALVRLIVGIPAMRETA
jgi:DNA-binding CsgD family transcriptional regulator